MVKPSTPRFYNRFYVVRSQPIMNVLSFGYMLAVAVFIINGITQYYLHNHVILFVFIGLLLVFLSWQMVQSAITKRRLAVHERHILAPNTGADYMLNTSLYKQFQSENGEKKVEYYLLQSTENWRMYDLGLAVTTIGSKGERGGTETTYHTVFEGKLTREVPNIVFDSHTALGRQFRSFYVGAQRLNLDVDMSEHYDAYAPYDYTIDTLSIIGPEVLYAMRQLALPCDIEFTGKTLVCYAPLLKYSEVEEYRRQCLDLLQKFNDTLDKYRDNHTLGLQRRDSVHGFARTLLQNPFYRWPALVLSAVILLGAITLCVFLIVTDSEAAPQLITNTIIFSLAALLEPWRAFKLWQSNKRQKESFEASMRFVQNQKNVY